MSTALIVALVSVSLLVNFACASSFRGPKGQTFTFPDTTVSDNGVFVNLGKANDCHVWDLEHGCYARRDPQSFSFAHEYERGVTLYYAGDTTRAGRNQATILLLCDSGPHTLHDRFYPLSVVKTYQYSYTITYKPVNCTVTTDHSTQPPIIPTSTPTAKMPTLSPNPAKMTITDPKGNMFTFTSHIMSAEHIYMDLRPEQDCHIWSAEPGSFPCYGGGLPKIEPHSEDTSKGVQLTYAGTPSVGCLGNQRKTNVHLICGGPIYPVHDLFDTMTVVKTSECQYDITYKPRDCMANWAPVTTNAPTIIPTPTDGPIPPYFPYVDDLTAFFLVGILFGTAFTAAIGFLIYFIKTRTIRFARTNRYVPLIPPAEIRIEQNPPYQIQHFYAY